MNVEEKLLQHPYKLSGKHFGDYLICKRRAWFNFFASDSLKAPDPSYLKSLQLDGSEFEKFIYSKTPFKSAKKIPQYKDKQRRIDETIKAIEDGESNILQAYLAYDDLVGISDVLEKVDDASVEKGYYYRVGDIKYSKDVTTAYVLQIYFYSFLLSKIQSFLPSEGFIILGNENRIDINFEPFVDIYKNIFEDLIKLRNTSFQSIEEIAPPILISACSSCAYRFICMDQIIKQKDLSLIPTFTPSTVAFLKSNGICSWAEIEINEPKLNTLIEIDQEEINKIADSIKRIKNRLPTFFDLLDSKKIKELIPISVELDKGKNKKSIKSVIKKILYIENGQEMCLDITSSKETFTLPDSFFNNGIISYGSDFTHIHKYLKENNYLNRIKSYDLLRIIENTVHYPFYGLELDIVLAQIQNMHNFNISDYSYKIPTPSQRLNGITRLIEWLIISINIVQNE